MKCISPPELDEKKLWAYVDGEADQETVQHVEKCEYCKGKASELTQLRNRVGSRLYRIHCPSTLELGEYHLGLLEGSEKLVVAQHIRDCQLCQREIAQLEEYLKELAGPPVKALIAQLIGGRGMDQDPLDSSMHPSVAGLRGEDDGPLIYQADHVQIAIEVQNDVEQMGRKTVSGLVTGSKSKDFTVQLIQEDQIVATSSVDKLGFFVFTHLKPGDYEIVLESSEGEIHIQSIHVM